MNQQTCYICQKYFPNAYALAQHICFEASPSQPDPRDARIAELEEKVAGKLGLWEMSVRDEISRLCAAVTGLREQVVARTQERNRLAGELATARERAIEECAIFMEQYGLQLYQEVDNYALHRAGVVLASFVVKIRALKSGDSNGG